MCVAKSSTSNRPVVCSRAPGYWSIGVLEYWSIGVLECCWGRMSAVRMNIERVSSVEESFSRQERQTIGAGAEWLQLATYPQSPFFEPAGCCDVAYLSQAFSQPTSPGRKPRTGHTELRPISLTTERTSRTEAIRVATRRLVRYRRVREWAKSLIWEIQHKIR